MDFRKYVIPAAFAAMFACGGAYASFTLSLGAYAQQQAEELHKHLSASGYPVYILYGETYEIRLGSYNSREEAEAVKSKLEETEKIAAQVIEEEDWDQAQTAWTLGEEPGKELKQDEAQNYRDPRARKLVSLGLNLFGHPYKYGGTKIGKGIDCSFFTQSIFMELGIQLPRTAREQILVGAKVGKDDLQVGDLVFFKKIYRLKSGKRVVSKRINHVAIYIGNDEIIHATRNVNRVTISRLSEPYFMERLAGARRVLEDSRLQVMTTR
jgi:cell wall-associated NlpC family hydrolase